MNLTKGDHVRTKRFPGVACWYIGPCDCGDSIIVMVGDDREHQVATDSLSRIDEDEFCGSCGQIGCAHG